MKTGLYFIIVVLLFSGCSTNQNNKENELTIFCAASLSDVMSDVIQEFENEHDEQVKINAASSGTLARQIEYGASPDIFISANKKWLDYLKDENRTVAGFDERVAGNSMVLVVPVNSVVQPIPFLQEINLPSLFNGRLSLGDHHHVPAGIYAMQILGQLGFTEQLQSRLLPAKDARSALRIVEMGEVEAGIVYKTDALKSKKVKIITEFPDTLHEPIEYYMALIHKNEKSIDPYNYILSEKSKGFWRNHGFKN